MIKGLTDSVFPAFPRLGKLRKGSPQENGRFGKELSWFRFTSDRPEVVEAFTGVYGPQPALLNVYLPYASLADNFQAWQEEWSAGGLVHRCDGEVMTLWRTSDGKYSSHPKPCPYAGHPEQRTKKEPGCRAVGRLTVVIPELIRAGYVGYVTLETHSLHDLMGIQATLLATVEARQGNTLGLRGIPFVLRRAQEEISTPTENGGRARRKKWLVKLEPAADWVALQLEAARQMALGAGMPSLQLVTGRLVNTATGEALDGGANLSEAPDLEDEEYEDGDFAADAARTGELPSDQLPIPQTLAEAYRQGAPSSAPLRQAQDGVQAPGAIHPTGDGQSPKLTVQQYNELGELVKRLYAPDYDRFQKWLQARYGVSERKALTQAQGAELIRLLQEEAAKAGLQPAAAALRHGPSANQDAAKPNGNGKPSGNGKHPKQAMIKTKLFFELAPDLASQAPHYQDKAGQPNTNHMAAAAYKLNFAEITDNNVIAVMDALRQHAQEAPGQSTVGTPTMTALPVVATHPQALLSANELRDYAAADAEGSADDESNEDEIAKGEYSSAENGKGNGHATADNGWDELHGSAKRIRARLQQQAQQAGNGTKSDAITFKKANGSLGILIRDKEKRHAVREWLFSVTNADELSAGQCAALIGWINAKKQTLENGTQVWLPAGQAVDELKVILAELGLAEAPIQEPA